MSPFRFLALCCLPIASASAQESSRVSYSGIEGVVVDSLRGGFLRGATVSVAGTSRIAFTDSLGRFRIDSIPAGAHQVELFHELLDTLAVRVYTPQIAFPADSVVSLGLGIPSAQTIIRAKCTVNNEEPGALIGMVLDAESEEPIAGAEVRLSWVELTIARESGLRYEPQRRSTTTDASGRYKVCGLPGDLSAEVSAARGTDSTAAVQIVYGESLLGMATIFLPTAQPAAAAGAVAAPSRVAAASVRGMVVDSAGRPVAGARVALAAGVDAVITDSTGRFVLSGQRSGTQALVVRRLGYQPVEMVVNLNSRRPSEVTVQLNAYVPVLEAVLVEGRRNFALDRVGFARRQRIGTGRYLGPQDLERRSAFQISDFLRAMPGFRVTADSVSGRFGDGVCFFVDGIHWRGGSPDDFVTPDEVAAIEVYSGSFVPAEFQTFDRCATVVIWTKWKLGLR